MMNTDFPVLLTSSVIAHDSSVALKDGNERIRLTLESVEKWLGIHPALRVVLCDGSNFDFSPHITALFPHAKIECLHFESKQDLVRQYGKGYGEGEIVRYALTHSKFITETKCFAKCTAKLWVENYQECIRSWNDSLLCQGIFRDAFNPFKKTRLTYIDTRFYVASCETYNKFFINAHLNIRKEAGHSLEECFLNAVLVNEIKKSFFSTPPVICGVGGGTGVPYKNPIKRILKEKLRLFLVKRNKDFTMMFS